MGSRWLKARNGYRKLFTLAVAVILLVLTLLSPFTAKAAELTATVKKYGNNWAVIYNPGEIYFAFEEVAKAELVPINTSNGTSYVVRVKDNMGNELPVTYAEARTYMQSKGYWQDEDLSKIQIQKETNQWWVIYPTTGQKVAFESVAEISLTFEITDNHDNVLPTTYGEALPYMQSKGYWKTDTNESRDDEEKGFWNFVTGKLNDIWELMKDLPESLISVVTSLDTIIKLIMTGDLFTAFVVGVVASCKPWASEISTFVFTISDQTELLFASNVGRVITGFAEKFGFMLWIIGFIIATSEIVISRKANKISESLRDYAMNTLKSFIAVIFFTTVPVPLYALCSNVTVKICQTLGVWGSASIRNFDFGSPLDVYISNIFPGSSDTFCLIFLIAIIFSGLKVIFSFIKRGGILLILIIVGSLHMINITRGYWDAFWGWCRQIIALCVTQFCQMTLFCGGIAIFAESLKGTELPLFIAGIGMFLAAAEVPRIADRFGIDSSLKGNAQSAIQTIVMVARKVVTKGA